MRRQIFGNAAQQGRRQPDMYFEPARPRSPALNTLLGGDDAARKSTVDESETFDTAGAQMAHQLDADFFRSAFESSLDCVSVLDPEGRLVLMNKGGVAAFEIVDLAPLIGQDCAVSWPEPAAGEIVRGLDAVRGGESYRFEGWRRTAHGAVKWWDITLAPVHGPDGELAGIIVTCRDITDAVRVRVEAEGRELSLTRTAAALRSASKIAHVGGWEVDFIKREALFSDELCELLGSPPLPAMPISESVLHWLEGDRAALQAALDRTEQQGERLTFEGRTLAPDGSMIWRRLFGEPVMIDNRCVAIHGAAQDIADWLSVLECERNAIRTAEAMSGFLATISHEIRTPLNGVLGMAQAMARGRPSPQQRQRLEVIETSGEALLSLLDDLLDLSKIEAGKILLEDGIVNTQQLAEGVRATFSELLLRKDVRLDVTLEPGARGDWEGDPGRIRQVLHNLMSNAVKFTLQGSVSICISHVRGRLSLQVQDTGIGIAQSKIVDVFDRFVQGDASTTRRYRGTGLGLTISRDLVTLMGGELLVESVEGVGSTFVVNLPLLRAAAAGPQTLEVEEPPSAIQLRSGLRVLAAEDNPTNQLVLRTLLATVGVEPVMVGNGQEALDAWSGEVWDVVLMDIQMPVMDGLTAVRRLRAAERGGGRRRTPIIAVTANATAHNKAEYLAAGMDDLIAKPIQMATLIQTMDSVLEADAVGRRQVALGVQRGPQPLSRRH
jgi:PAS domain S-box-containing protein